MSPAQPEDFTVSHFVHQTATRSRDIIDTLTEPLEPPDGPSRDVVREAAAAAASTNETDTGLAPGAGGLLTWPPTAAGGGRRLRRQVAKISFFGNLPFLEV